MNVCRTLICLVLVGTLCPASARATDSPTNRPFEIVVVDSQTGRGVPLVELRTVNNIRYYTDSAGVVAFFEPGLMNSNVFFHVASHGYEFPKDGFGFRGKALRVTPGGSVRLEIKRVNVAQRLYRVTGGGIYRDSRLLGRDVPLREPVLAGSVLGSDSVLTAVFGGRIYWFWGDTNRPGYPLGNFHVPAATSLLPGRGGLDPDVGVDLSYFVDDRGFAKETARMPGAGPTWISGLTVLSDASGRELMFASYVKIRKFLEVHERGLVEFDPKARRFDMLARFDVAEPLFPSGHPILHETDGVEYVYFADPFPLVRVAADPKSFADLSRYEAYTPLAEGSRPADGNNRLDRAEDGTLRYTWKKKTPPLGPREIARLIQREQMEPGQLAPQLLTDADGKPVIAHRGSVYWNEYRRRFVMIATETGGTSHLGEVWYAEADALTGPWRGATKIVSHDDYSFYNPKQHPMFDADGGRTIYFEGTYVSTFSGNANPTPRYDYNQIMYKLDLSDPRLGLVDRD